MKLIDAERLADELAVLLERNEGLIDEWLAWAIEDTLEEQPPADKHAHWIECLTSDHWKCSKCGDRAPIYWDGENMSYAEWLAPYCPNCGAKMDQKEEQE